MMIHLYIKTHNITGLKYFGKTESSNPEKYKGSGTYWKRHIKIHGYDVETKILGSFENAEEALQVALQFSLENDIMNSALWANLKNETLEGGFEHINSISKEERSKFFSDLYYAQSEETKKLWNSKKSNSGAKNGMFGVDRTGENAPFLGKKHDEDTKRAISLANAGKIVMKNALTGEIVGSFTKDQPEYVSGEWVSINVGRKATLETKEKMSIASKLAGNKPPSSKGKLWWNNGKEVIRSIECPGPGFVRGRKV